MPRLPDDSRLPLPTMRFLLWILCLLGFSSTFSASIGRNVPCEPGELVFVDCNLCTCNPQGFPNSVCARMWCQPPPKNKLLDTNDIATA